MAYQGHIVIPTSHEKSQQIIDEVTAKMVVRFGGYSLYEGSGGWQGSEGMVTEDHVRIVVNAQESAESRESFTETLRIEALYAKDVMDEDAVLIEIHDMEMELV